MWHEVLMIALLVSPNPILLAFTLLVVSRPRSVQNLAAFWIGSLTVNVSALLLSLFALHQIPAVADFARALAAPEPGTSVRPFQLCSGVLAIGVMALMAVRMRNSARRSVAVGAGGVESVLPEDAAVGRAAAPLGRVRAAIVRVEQSAKRLAARAQGAWGSGSLWVSVMMGMGYCASLPMVFLVGTMIIASGASVGVQVTAVAAFVVVMLGVVELSLLGYVMSPARTQAVLKPVHDWSAAHRQHILMTLLLVIGVSQLARGVGIP